MTWTTRPRSNIGGLAAISCGAGPTVLLLHGVGLRAEAWGAQLDGLPAQMIAPDMPGHGDSALPAGYVDMESYVAAALDVLAACGEPAVIVGHSMGAMLALALAARAPEKVLAVAALNAVFERSPSAAQAVQARAASLDGQSAPDPTAALERWFGTDETPERAACAAWLGDVNPAAYKSAYHSFAHSEIPNRDMLASIACPALFMTGRDEPNSTPAMSETMAALAPKGRALVVTGAAHMMPMSHARETNAALRLLIEEVST